MDIEFFLTILTNWIVSYSLTKSTELHRFLDFERKHDQELDKMDFTINRKELDGLQQFEEID